MSKNCNNQLCISQFTILLVITPLITSLANSNNPKTSSFIYIPHFSDSHGGQGSLIKSDEGKSSYARHNNESPNDESDNKEPQDDNETSVIHQTIKAHSILSALSHHLDSLLSPTHFWLLSPSLISHSASQPFSIKCLPLCSCKLDLFRSRSETTCRSMTYETLMDSLKNVTGTNVKVIGMKNTTENDYNRNVKGDQGAIGNVKDIMVNDLWKRNRGRENRITNNPPSKFFIDSHNYFNSVTDDNVYKMNVHNSTKKNHYVYNITSLTFSFNNIPYLKREIFKTIALLDEGKGLDELEELYFYFNKIISINEDVFDDFNNVRLKSAGDSNNSRGLKRIKIVEHHWHLNPNEYFSEFPVKSIRPFATTLEQLQISSPNVRAFPITSLGHFIRLKTLIIKSAVLSDVGAKSNDSYHSTGNIPPNLYELQLIGDSLETVPKFSVVTNQVKKFTLSSLALVRIYNDDFENNFSSLEELFIINCNISYIHYFAFKPLSTTLVHLDLQNNRLRNLDPRTFQNLNKLRVINLSGNDLVHILDGCFNNMPSLEFISLKYNRISSIGLILTNSSSVKTWLMKSNSLGDVPKNALAKLPNIETLDLSRNFIAKLKKFSFENNKKLVSLDLSSNHLYLLEPNSFKGLEDSLHDLKIFHNRISYIAPAVLKDLKKLSLFDLSYNNLTSLSVELFENCQDSLTYMDISFNPWHCDCNMRVFRLWMEARISNLFFLHRFKARTILSRAKCATPLHMISVPISYPPLNAFMCDSEIREIESHINNSRKNYDRGLYNYSSNSFDIIHEFGEEEDTGPEEKHDFTTTESMSHSENMSLNSFEESKDFAGEEAKVDINEKGKVSEKNGTLSNAQIATILAKQQSFDVFLLKEIKGLFNILDMVFNSSNASHLGASSHRINDHLFEESLSQQQGQIKNQPYRGHHLSRLSLALSGIAILAILCLFYLFFYRDKKESHLKYGPNLTSHLSNVGNSGNYLYPPHHTLSRLSSSPLSSGPSSDNNNTKSISNHSPSNSRNANFTLSSSDQGNDIVANKSSGIISMDDSYFNSNGTHIGGLSSQFSASTTSLTSHLPGGHKLAFNKWKPGRFHKLFKRAPF